jgi:hypothetical protein
VEIDVTDPSPEEPGAIRQDQDGYEFVGLADANLPDDSRDGILYLRIAGSLVMFDIDGLSVDAGKRLRVRQKIPEVFRALLPPATLNDSTSVSATPVLGRQGATLAQSGWLLSF